MVGSEERVDADGFLDDIRFKFTREREGDSSSVQSESVALSVTVNGRDLHAVPVFHVFGESKTT